MPGSNQFLPFAIGSGANTLTPSAYAALTPLLNLGFQSGVAQSIQFNTVLRQAAFVASAIAQFIANQGPNALDDGNQSGFVANLTSAIASSIAGTYLTAANAVTTYAPIASPALTGNPTAPTQTAGDSSTKVSTTAFVAAAIAAANTTQSYHDVTTSRATGTTYTNSGTRPIKVLFTGSDATSQLLNAVGIVGGVSVAWLTGTGASNAATLSFEVPPGATYSVTRNASANYTKWFELY